MDTGRIERYLVDLANRPQVPLSDPPQFNVGGYAPLNGDLPVRHLGTVTVEQAAALLLDFFDTAR
jgi:hypothetical protein